MSLLRTLLLLVPLSPLSVAEARAETDDPIDRSRRKQLLGEHRR